MKNQELNINISKNTLDFIIKQNLQLDQLMRFEELQNLSMQEWYDLIKFKDNYVSTYMLREILINKINRYDKSDNVNKFTLFGKEGWFDKNTRASLLALVSCSDETITLVLEDELVELSINDAKKFLSQLEVYASKCYVNTQKHLNALKELRTFEDLINYDYTKGYPEKITVNE